MKRLFPWIALAAFCGCEEGDLPDEAVLSRAAGATLVAKPAAAVENANAENTSLEPAPANGGTDSSAANAAESNSATDDPPKPTIEPIPDSWKVDPEKARQPLLRLTFDNLKFEMEKGATFERKMITPKIESYVGRKVKIPGYIYPTYNQEITQFVLCRDDMECCFGPGAAIYDSIQVYMQDGKVAKYTDRPVTVEGIMSLSEYVDYDGEIRSIYRIDGISVK